MYDEKQLQNRRDEKKGSVDNSYWAINASQDDGEPYTTAVEALSYKAVEIGSCELQLGNVEAAREWFARAALAERSYLYQLVTRWDDLGPVAQTKGGKRSLSAITNALLSGDHHLITAVSEQVLTLDGEYRDNYAETDKQYWKACTIATLADRDDTAAAEYLNIYNGLLDDENLDPHSDALVRSFTGFIEDDREQVSEALRQMVDYHGSIIDELPSRLEPINRVGCALLLLARDRVMAIDIDSRYLPDALDEYGIDGEIELPRPDYLREELVVGE
ncbi:Imm49 family immunity protein [Natrinema sp. 74]|uniref:Imm49 family immunity protein n=1 Tax=Natrinema sp. 74 TaxID=3384159 RepID=UPI0038D41E11